LNIAAIPDLSSRELQAVCTIAEYGSFMAASLTLNMSQPALTRTVQRVESAIGLELFRRSTRRVETTPAGIEFIALANRILSDLRISFENMRDIADEQRGRVIISAVMSVSYTQLPRLVAGYRLTRQRIEIQLREGVHGTVMQDVRSGVADLGITYIEDIPSEFQSLELGREAFHVVMPRGHPLANKSGITLADLKDLALVSLPKEAQTRRLLDGLASMEGVNLQHAVTVHQFATVMQCVHAGVGLALVPGGAIPSAMSAGLVSRPLVKPALSRTMGVVMLKDRSLTPSAKGFLAHLEAFWSPTKPGERIAAPKAKRPGKAG
jgi:DNA-binding transcriptional LysR family regulator